MTLEVLRTDIEAQSTVRDRVAVLIHGIQSLMQNAANNGDWEQVRGLAVEMAERSEEFGLLVQGTETEEVQRSLAPMAKAGGHDVRELEHPSADSNRMGLGQLDQEREHAKGADVAKAQEPRLSEGEKRGHAEETREGARTATTKAEDKPQSHTHVQREQPAQKK